MIITATICSIFNYFATRGDIEIKLVPKSIMVLLLFFFSSLSQLLIIPILGYDLENLTSNQNLILTSFSDGVLLLILFVIYFKTLKTDLKHICILYFKMIILYKKQIKEKN